MLPIQIGGLRVHCLGKVMSMLSPRHFLHAICMSLCVYEVSMIKELLV